MWGSGTFFGKAIVRNWRHFSMYPAHRIFHCALCMLRIRIHSYNPAHRLYAKWPLKTGWKWADICKMCTLIQNFKTKQNSPKKRFFFSRKWVRASIYIYAILSGGTRISQRNGQKKTDLHREVANATIFQNLTYVFLFIPVFYYRNRRTRKRNKYTHKNPYFLAKAARSRTWYFHQLLVCLSILKLCVSFTRWPETDSGFDFVAYFTEEVSTF